MNQRKILFIIYKILNLIKIHFNELNIIYKCIVLQ